MINAQYTVVLKSIMDNPESRKALDIALSDYPLYEKVSREELNKKILNHYKYREIGSETVGRFLDEFRTTMHEIMPYYNQLYKSQDIMDNIEDPFGNVDIEEKFEEKTTGIGESTSASSSNTISNTESDTETNTKITNNSKNVKSSEPQSQLNIAAKDIDTLEHADESTWDQNINDSESKTTDTANSSSENTSSGNSTNTTSGTRTTTYTKKGNQGVNTYAHDMIELRETFLNIDKMIIDDKNIQDLFLQVW